MPQRMWKMCVGAPPAGWVVVCDRFGHANEVRRLEVRHARKHGDPSVSYGTRPIGRMHAGCELLSACFKRCEQCEGEGLLTDWTTVPGSGARRARRPALSSECDAETIRRIHEQIEAQFSWRRCHSGRHPLKRCCADSRSLDWEIVGSTTQSTETYQERRRQKRRLHASLLLRKRLRLFVGTRTFGHDPPPHLARCDPRSWYMGVCLSPFLSPLILQIGTFQCERAHAAGLKFTLILLLEVTVRSDVKLSDS
jgi:hypothetical protein